MKKLITFCIGFAFYIPAFAQSNDDYNTYANINSVYRIPQSRNGLTESAFKITARVRMVRWEKMAQIILNISSVQSTPSRPDPSFLQSYNYMGKLYGNQHVDTPPFSSIRADGLSYEVKVLYDGKIWIKKVDGYDNIIAEVARNAKASEVTVYVKVVNIQSFNGTNDMEGKIKALLKAEDDKKKAVELSQNTAINAKAGQQGASSLQKTTTSNPAGPAKQGLASNISSANNVPVNSAPGVTNQPALGVYNGKYYQRGTDGKYEQISEEAYRKAKATNTAQKQPAETTVQPAVNPESYLLKDPSAATETSIAFNQQLEQRTTAIQQSFYAAESIAASKRNIGKLTTLDGNYQSVEELEAEFQSKYRDISAEMQTLTESRNQVISSTKDFFVAGGDQKTQAIGEAVAVLGNIFNEIRAKREEARAKEELERRRQEQLARIEARKLALLVELRQRLLNQFRDGGVPLSYHKITTEKLYFFAYILNKRDINNSHVDVAVSKVFVLDRFKDGTWPFKSSVVNELKRFKADGTVVLSGYYNKQQMAEDMHSAFLLLSAKSGVTKTEFNYVRQAASTEKTANDDVWGSAEPVRAQLELPGSPQMNKYAEIVEAFNQTEETNSNLYYTKAYFDKLTAIEQSAGAFLQQYKNAGTELSQEVYRIKEAVIEQKKGLAQKTTTGVEFHRLYLSYAGASIRKGEKNPLNSFTGFGKVWLPGRKLADIAGDLNTDAGMKQPGDLNKSSALALDFISIDTKGYVYRQNALKAGFTGAAYILDAMPVPAHTFTDKEQQQWITDYIILDDLNLEKYHQGQSITKNAKKGLLAVSLESAYFSGADRKLVALRYNASGNGDINVIDALRKLFGEPAIDYGNEDNTTASHQWIGDRFMITATRHQGVNITQWTDLFIEDMQAMTAANANYYAASLDAYRLYNADKQDKFDGGLLPGSISAGNVKNQKCLQINDLPVGSSLYKAGIRKGDMLVSIDNFITSTYLGFVSLWNTGIEGKRKLLILRNNETVTIEI